MKKWLIGPALSLSLLCAPPLWADELTLRPDVPEQYIVQRGDTLWDIARMYLHEPWRWEDIWLINPQVDNPHLIYPGDVLRLTWVDGEPRLTIDERAEQTMRLTEDDMDDDGTVRLSPRVRVETLDGAIPTIPRERISAFLSRSLIVSEERLDEAAYVVGGDEGRIVLGAGDRIYARGSDWGETGDRYEVFRRGERYVDAETRETLGIEAIALGMAELETRQDDIARVQLTQSRQNIRVGDRLLLISRESPSSVFFPAAPDRDLTGVILNKADGGQLIGQFDVVLLNRGAADGVTEGHVFDIARPGEQIRDPLNNDVLQLPGDRSGSLMVFRVFDRLSYGLVMNATNTIRVGDHIQSPELSSLP